nr:MFS transporter [Streptomyces sp. SAJ15]
MRGQTAGNAPDPALSRLRAALTLFFALDGFVFAGWVVRIPAVKEQTGASPGALGLALLGVSAGAVATMVVTGRLCRRFGSHPMTVAAAVLMSLSVALPPLTHSALALGLVLLAFGAGFGGLNVAMNSAAVDLVAALRRPVMPTLHAAFSLGGMAGAGLGGLVAGHLSATRHLALLAAAGVLLALFAGRTLIALPAPTVPDTAATATPDGPATDATASDDGRPRAEGHSARAGGSRWPVLVFGLIALCTAYGEGAMADWAALHLDQDLGASPGMAAAGYSLFALAMTVGRLTGSALLERLGQTRALVAGGATAAAGMLLGSLAPVLPLALAGFAVTGLGLANIFPIAIGRAGALAGPDGVATASTLGYAGMLLGPPTIGFLADWSSLSTALTTVALLSALAAAVAYGTRHTVHDTGRRTAGRKPRST